jgi:hypothetical protein
MLGAILAGAALLVNEPQLPLDESEIVEFGDSVCTVDELNVDGSQCQWLERLECETDGSVWTLDGCKEDRGDL